MTYTFSGTVKSVGQTQTFGSKGFQKRTLVLEDDGDSKYPNLVQFNLKKDKCELADGLKEGDHVSVKFALSGRAWDKDGVVRYFTDLDIFNIEGGSSSSGSNAKSPLGRVELPEEMPDSGGGEDLPF
ncbi:MAG: DUF3127 domain-containing protein [Bacteroidales bacterium]|nr:DUF3127 domain-containing protein [Bacteroidales bacterium]